VEKLKAELNNFIEKLESSDIKDAVIQAYKRQYKLS